MMPAANQGVGMNMGFPDVCTTPAAPAPIPIPYPNIGMNAMAMPFVPNVLVSMAPAQNMGAKPLLTNGDNAGVAHPLFMQPGGTTVGKVNLLMGGMPAAHLTNPTYGNNFNNPVGAKIVPSITNVLMGSTAALAPDQRRAAARAVRREAGALRVGAHGVLELRLPCVSLRADRWLERRLRGLRHRSLRGVLVDLRANPGGALAVAVRLARRLLALDLPLAVVTDRGTASAAELLAAMLRDRGAARIFGSQTYGKGRARAYAVHADDLVELPVSGTFTRPDGDPIDGRGLPADHPCRLAEARGEALRWLRTRPNRHDR